MSSQVGRHVTRYFRGHPVFAVDVPPDARDRAPGLEILEIGGGPRTRLNTYVTLGCWEAVQSCDRLFVTLPYPYGPDLEWCRWRRSSARLLWLMPIMPSEAAYVDEHGVEALERRFEETQVHFADPDRPPVV